MDAGWAARELNVSGGNKIEVKKAVEMVCESMGVQPEMLQSRQHIPSVFMTRFLAAYLLREIWGLSSTQIAKYVGYENHCSVLYAIRRLESGLRSDARLRSVLETLRADILCQLPTEARVK